MTARMRVVFVSSGQTVGIVAVGVRRPVIVVMPAAFGQVAVVVGMIQREHTPAEPGDHAEHQEP